MTNIRASHLRSDDPAVKQKADELIADVSRPRGRLVKEPRNGGRSAADYRSVMRAMYSSDPRKAWKPDLTRLP